MLKTKEDARSLRAKAAGELGSASESERWRALTLLTQATAIERELGIPAQVSSEEIKKSENAALRRGEESMKVWINREEEIKNMVKEYIKPVEQLPKLGSEAKRKGSGRTSVVGYKPVRSQLEFKY